MPTFESPEPGNENIVEWKPGSGTNESGEVRESAEKKAKAARFVHEKFSEFLDRQQEVQREHARYTVDGEQYEADLDEVSDAMVCLTDAYLTAAQHTLAEIQDSQRHKEEGQASTAVEYHSEVIANHLVSALQDYHSFTKQLAAMHNRYPEMYQSIEDTLGTLVSDLRERGEELSDAA